MGVPKILFFLFLKIPPQISEPYDNDTIIKVSEAERRKKERGEKNAVNSGHLVL